MLVGRESVCQKKKKPSSDRRHDSQQRDRGERGERKREREEDKEQKKRKTAEIKREREKQRGRDAGKKNKRGCCFEAE